MGELRGRRGKRSGWGERDVHAPEERPKRTATATTPPVEVAPKSAKMSAAEAAMQGSIMLYTPNLSARATGIVRPRVLPAFSMASCGMGEHYQKAVRDMRMRTMYVVTVALTL